MCREGEKRPGRAALVGGTERGTEHGTERGTEGDAAVTEGQPATGEAAVLDALLAANVQFVAVGEPGERGGMGLVVSRHPTNLHVLGALLERLEASLRLSGTTVPSVPSVPSVPNVPNVRSGRSAPIAAGVDGSESGADAGVLRIGDPYATVSVRALGVDVDLMFGGPRRSLYAEALGVATDRVIFGRRVKWAPAPPDVAPVERRTGSVLGRRLLSIAEGLAHVVDRGGEPPAGTGEPGPGDPKS